MRHQKRQFTDGFYSSGNGRIFPAHTKHHTKGTDTMSNEEEAIYRICAEYFTKWILSEDRAGKITDEPEAPYLAHALNQMKPKLADNNGMLETFFTFYSGMGAGMELVEAIESNSQSMKKFGERELTASELNMLHYYRKLSEMKQGQITGYIYALLATQEEERKAKDRIVPFKHRSKITQ